MELGHDEAGLVEILNVVVDGAALAARLAQQSLHKT